jgi:glucokinase
VTAGLTVGIDVGGTKTACVVTDAEDRMLMHEVEPTQADRLTGQLSALVQRAVNQLAVTDSRSIDAVGVAVPGRVEPRSGTVGLAVNLGGDDLALGPLLEASVGLPCYVEHDARAAATWIHSSNGDSADGITTADDMAYLSVGTGISAGIVLDGRVLRGANGLAGEVGHIVADPYAGRCACGLPGCAEVVAAGPAIARLAQEAAAAGRHTVLGPGATAADVFQAAAAGDEIATQLASQIAERLVWIIRGLVLTLGVRHIVVGGGVAAAGEALLTRLNDAIERERRISPLVEAAFAEATIELLSPNVEAGARGAAVIARRRIQADQREGVGER